MKSCVESKGLHIPTWFCTSCPNVRPYYRAGSVIHSLPHLVRSFVNMTLVIYPAEFVPVDTAIPVGSLRTMLQTRGRNVMTRTMEASHTRNY